MLAIVDLTEVDAPVIAAEQQMRTLILDAAGLTVAPMFRFALFRVATDRWLWFQSYHHLCMDGAGLRQVAALVASAYSTLLRPGAGVFGPVDDLPGPARIALPADAMELAAAYWYDLLNDWSGPIRLAGRTADPSDLAMLEPVQISGVVAGRLRKAARAAGLPLAHVLLAAAALWLNAVSGETDVVLGLAVRARGQGAGNAPAMTTNVVPVRVAVTASSTVLTLARDIARQRRRGRSHERVRGAHVLRRLSLSSARSFGPSVNIMPFGYEFSFDGMDCHARNVSIGPVDDLCLSIYDRRDGQGLTAGLNANPALYSRDQVRTYAARLRRLLVLLARQPDLGASGIDLLDAAERRQVLETWNDTEHAVPAAGLFELFAAQATARPDAQFLVEAGTRLSYGAARAVAARLARELRERHPGCMMFAVVLPRSPEFFIALLAISMIGAAFAPIDPANPRARIAAMLGELDTPGIITSTAGLPLLSDRPGIVVPDEGWFDSTPQAGAGHADVEPVRFEPTPFEPMRAAYTIFTSGTTGRPKGVVVLQQGLASLAAYQAHHLRLSAGSRVLQFAAVGFDAAIMELLMALAAGACLVLPHADERHGTALGQFLTRHDITHALLPPAALLGLDAATQAAPATLVVGGEACPAALAREWSVGRAMINAYGPTEATICSTMSDPLQGDAPPSIGRPIWNTRAYVLDAFGRPVPVGTEGELHIAGSGLAAGYLGDPSLTDLRFIACRFGPGGRMFRTGDRARFRGDGSLECLGRADRQVKVRGVRIEPAEIEAALGRLPGVVQAVVTSRRSAAGLVRLVGYVVLQRGAQGDAATLRAGLALQVPLAMVPADLVVLAQLPLTRHGKIDVQALPPPPEAPGVAAPETMGERRLADLFAEVLERPQVALEDDFFDLGGDSLAATLLVQRVHEALDCTLTIGDVFAHPTLAGLARRIADQGAPHVSPLAGMLGFRVNAAKPALFCVHTGSGLGWAYSALLRHLGPGQPMYALQARGLDGRSEPTLDLSALASDYANQIRRVQPSGPYHLLGWSSGGPLAHLVATHLQAAGDEVGLLISLDGYPTGPHYAAGVPSQDARAAAREDLRRAIQVYLAASPSLGIDEQDLLDDGVLGRMIDIHVNTGQLLVAGRLGVFKGDLLLFTCTEPYQPTPLPLPDIWGAFITGRVETIVVEGSHDMMLLPAPAEVIGTAIARRLLDWAARSLSELARTIPDPKGNVASAG